MFHNRQEHLSVNGRADDGSDESIFSAQIAVRPDFNGVGKIGKVKPITLLVALKTDTGTQSFTFSRTWTPPRTVLKLSAGPVALLIVNFLVADAILTSQGILFG